MGAMKVVKRSAQREIEIDKLNAHHIIMAVRQQRCVPHHNSLFFLNYRDGDYFWDEICSTNCSGPWENGAATIQDAVKNIIDDNFTIIAGDDLTQVMSDVIKMMDK